MNKEKELLKLQLENLTNLNKSIYYKNKNENLVKEVSFLEAELDMLYKRIELCKKFCNDKKIRLRNGTQSFDCYSGVDVVVSILNGTSNYAKLEGLKDFEECEVLNE